MPGELQQTMNFALMIVGSSTREALWLFVLCLIDWTSAKLWQCVPGTLVGSVWAELVSRWKLHAFPMEAGLPCFRSVSPCYPELILAFGKVLPCCKNGFSSDENGGGIVQILTVAFEAH